MNISKISIKLTFRNLLSSGKFWEELRNVRIFYSIIPIIGFISNQEEVEEINSERIRAKMLKMSFQVIHSNKIF